MSDVGKRVIFVGPADGSAFAHPLNVEGVADAAIAPGTLVKNTATGLDASDDAATVFGTLPLFADKNQMQSKSVDDSWVSGENMVAIQLRSGEFANVLVATGQTLAVGDPLISNGAGLLVKGTGANTENVICNADEAITTAATTLVRVVAA